MKTIRTYVFIFVPIPSDCLDNERSRWLGVRPRKCEPEEPAQSATLDVVRQ
jgi:hypothetical protein